jgi:hypothetical protein
MVDTGYCLLAAMNGPSCAVIDGVVAATEATLAGSFFPRFQFLALSAFLAAPSQLRPRPPVSEPASALIGWSVDRLTRPLVNIISPRHVPFVTTSSALKPPSPPLDGRVLSMYRNMRCLKLRRLHASDTKLMR